MFTRINENEFFFSWFRYTPKDTIFSAYVYTQFGNMFILGVIKDN